MKYDHIQIEKKWQKFWLENKTFRTPELEKLDKSKPKCYVLDMLPYPSGDGLHVGHPEGYTATDIISRFKRMRGFNVLHPMGWDAFGLPAEQFAVKKEIHPRIGIDECVIRFRQQLQSLGFSYDWDREINTTDEKFYKWTQWMFLKIYNSYFDQKENKAKPISKLTVPAGLTEEEKYNYINSQRLAYISESPVNWCPELGTVLANEEVPEQVEKGFTVVRRPMKQWKIRITKYAQRLLDDLESLQWPENIKKLQINWIGRSEGATVKFNIVKSESDFIEVFTTRPDTLFGATYMVLAPEHPLIKSITTDDYKAQVEKYISDSERKSDMERAELDKTKTGVFTGAYAINPVNDKEIPVWIADYVLMTYGTGAIMCVPGHDERDSEFAVKFGLPIEPVVMSSKIKDDEKDNFFENTRKGKECYTDEGISVNSGFISGLTTSEAKEKMNQWIEEKGIGKRSINYKLRDWLFSRQRYWGEPFPIVHLESGRIVALKEKDLPVTLPVVKSYKPSGTGESPLATIDEWVNTKYEGQNARRETNTMPQWAGSCWYFLRYIDPDNSEIFCDKKLDEYWNPVDLYIGGSEHAVLHLLYARFWHKLLFDLGFLTYPEPFNTLFNQGMILGEDGVKMSKSRGNVINPDDMINEFGADSMRLFEMFMGPLEDTKPWSTEGMAGMNRFLNRVWRLIMDERTGELNQNLTDEEPAPEVQKLLHNTIKKMTADIEDGDMKFNTSIAQMMIFVNEMYKQPKISKSVMKVFVLLLSPYAPHIAEELWQIFGEKESIAYVSWPKYNDELTKADKITVMFSVNGKVRSKAEVDAGTDEKILEETALADAMIQKYIAGKHVVKIIVVKNKMVNIVVKG